MRVNQGWSASRQIVRRSVSQRLAAWSEELEGRCLLASVALISGSPAGEAAFSWRLHSQPPVVESDSSGLILDDSAPHGNDLYYISQMESGNSSTPVAVIEAYIGGGAGLQVGNSPRDFDTEFRARILAAASNPGVKNSAEASVGGSLLYQLVGTNASEHIGTPVDLSFQMDAILGASQFSNPGDAAGVGLNYVVSYDIYRIIQIDDEIIIVHLAKEEFTGSATVLTGSAPGMFDRFERSFPVEAEIGDYIALNVELDSFVTESSTYTAQIEAYVGFDWNLGEVEPPPITISVGAQFNELGDSTSETLRRGVPRDIQISSDRFGPYLPGIELSNKFTVNIIGENTDAVTLVEWSIGQTSGMATQVANSDQWTFTTNMGSYAAGTHDLVVRAFSSSGETLQEYQGEVVHSSTLNFELSVDPGATDDLIPVEDARFFQGISASLQFEGTIDGLAKFYANKAKIYVGNTAVSATFTNTAAGAPAKFTFTYNVSSLTSGPTGTIGVDVQFGTKSVTDFGDVKEFLTAVPKPTWLANSSISYNSQTGEYEFHNYRPSLFDYSATITKTGQKWLDNRLKKLDTFARMEAVLNIDAPVQVTQAPTFDASQLIVKAQVLGEKIADATYGSSTLDFGGSLNSKTLDPTDVSIRLQNPALIANQTFLNRQFSFNLVDKLVPGLPEWLVSARFEMALKLMSSLTVDAGVELTKVGTTVQYVAAGTFLTLAADPTATATAQLVAKVGGGWLADFIGSATGTATLNLSTTANFSGNIGSVPKLESASLSAKFTFAYRVQIEGTLAKSVRFVSYDSAAPENGGPTDDVFGPYELLTLSTKPSKPGKNRS